MKTTLHVFIVHADRQIIAFSSYLDAHELSAIPRILDVQGASVVKIVYQTPAIDGYATSRVRQNTRL
jgi:hypothetical protein